MSLFFLKFLMWICQIFFSTPWKHFFNVNLSQIFFPHIFFRGKSIFFTMKFFLPPYLVLVNASINFGNVAHFIFAPNSSLIITSSVSGTSNAYVCNSIAGTFFFCISSSVLLDNCVNIFTIVLKEGLWSGLLCQHSWMSFLGILKGDAHGCYL